MWDQRKSNQGKGDMWAPCPFHQEKSASFHVDDRKGFYYCFGCHEKGDALSFIQATENVGFMEAVEILAREAGMTMPARDPRAQEKADRRTELAKVTEAAVAWYRMQLSSGAGADARAYIDRRGLDQAALDRFEIGYAPNARQGAFQALKDKGFDPDLIVAAGIATKPDDGGAPYDAFRDRITFPIRDPRGRCIGFGGRAMDPNARAKYLNSRETELFDKGRALYNHGPAREAAGKGQPLIVAEGYMDVIALALSGFGATVAPLGTAVTEDQLRLMWRMSPEPVIALDGDKAGLNAAYRLIDLGLPLIAAGQSLRFALMPEGKDPDDLLRGPNGRDTMQGLIDNALMVNLLWRRESEGQVFDSPERKAMLDKVLKDKTGLIRDPIVRKHYDDALYQLKRDLFFQPRQRPQQGQKWRPFNQRASHNPETKGSFLAAAQENEQEILHEAVLLAVLIKVPDIVVDYEHALEDLDLHSDLHQRVRHIMLRYAHNGAEVLQAELEQQLGVEALAKLLGAPHVAIVPALRRLDDHDLARMTVEAELDKLNSLRGHRQEMLEALEDMQDRPSEALTHRLKEATEARNRAERSQQEDRTEFDVAPNGAQLSRDELKRRNELFDSIPFTKNKH